MPIINLFDRVKQKSTTAGSGNITFTSSVAAFVDFSGVYTDGDELYYAIENLTDFEVGIGTYSGNTLSRDTVLKSSNSDNLLDLPGDANTFVYNTYAASGAVYTSGDRLVTNVDGIDFNPIANGSQPSHQEGRVFYDLDNHALAVYNDEAEITLQVGQEEYLRVRNNTTGTIFNGEAVRIIGSQGTQPIIDKAIATNDIDAQAIGLATHDIEQNSFGYITTYGVVNNVDTSAFSSGQEIFLSYAISGGLTGVSPVAPNFKLSMGHVLRSHPNVGNILVKPSTTKLGGGDVKSLGNFQESGIAFIDLVAGSNAAIISSNTGLSYNSGTNTLQVDAGGVRFPDGATQTIAYTGQDADGLSSAVTVQLSNQATGSATFQNGGDTADISTFLTAAAISGQGSTSSIADADKILIERGAALRQVRKDILVTGLATESYVNTVSGNLQTQITSNDGDISTLQANDTIISGIAQGAADDVATASGYLQGQIDTNDTDISALQTATGNLDTRVTQNASDITTVSGIAQDAADDVDTVSGLLYNNWNIAVTGNSDSIGSNETLNFIGLGDISLIYDDTFNIVYISGSGEAGGGGSTPTGIGSGVAFFSSVSNELTGVSNFVYNQTLNQLGLNTDPQAGLHVKNDTSAYPVLTVEAGAGQALPLTRWINENGVVVATVDYESGLIATSGGVTFPDGVTQTIAYTGQTSEPTGTASGIAFFGDDNLLTTSSNFEFDDANTGIYLYRSATNRLEIRPDSVGSYSNVYNIYAGFGTDREVMIQPANRLLICSLDNAARGRIRLGNQLSYYGDIAQTSFGNLTLTAFRDNGQTSLSLVGGTAAGSTYGIQSKTFHRMQKDLRVDGQGDFNSGIVVTSAVSTDIPLLVQGAASQSANLQEWQDSAGNAYSRITSDGRFSNPTANNTEVFGDAAVGFTSGVNNIIVTDSGSVYNASTVNNRLTVVGSQATFNGSTDDFILVGSTASIGAGTNTGIVLGNSANIGANDDFTIVVGHDSNTDGTDDITIGHEVVNSSSTNSVKVGNRIQTGGSNHILIGNDMIGATNAIGIGHGSYPGNNAVVIGNNQTTSNGTIVIMANSQTGIYVDSIGNLTIRETGIFQSGVQFPDGVTQTIAYTGQETSPGGSDTYVQFNDGGSFGGDANFTWNTGTDTLTVSGSTLISNTGTVFEVTNTGGTTLFAVEDSDEVQVIVAAQVGQSGNPFEVRDEFDLTAASIDVSGNISGNNISFGDGTTQTTAYPAAVVEDATTSITLSCSSHANKHLRTTSASAVTITIPSGLGCDANSIFTFEQAGAGGVGISGAPGVTLNSFNSATGIEGQYAVAHLKQVTTDTYTLYGDIA